MPGALPQQSPSKLIRSADGKMRVDFGNTSMITDPAAQKTILLDHIKKEAMTVLPSHLAAPQVNAPAIPGGLPTSPVPPQVQDLGKALIEGQEVEGKLFTFQNPVLPKPPGLPQMPAMPQAPGVPQAPQMPQVPPMPTTAEVWTSTATQLPVLTKITGPYGQQICQCRTAVAAEPPPTTFQIPPDYKQVALPMPQPPPVPTPPQPPSLKPPSFAR